MGNYWSSTAEPWKGKVCVVTGAADGMGKQLALTLAMRGAKGLALADINMGRLEDTAKYIRGQRGILVDQNFLITTHYVDVSSRDAMFRFAEDVVQQHGGVVDALFNNAGIVCANSTDGSSIEEWERVLKVDLFGVFYGMKAFLPALKRSKQAYVANTSSMAGIGAFPGNSAYATSKFGVRGMTECFMMECNALNKNIHVAVVHPGMVTTNIFQNCKEYIHDVSATVDAKTLGFTLPKEYRMKNASDMDWLLKNAGSTTPAQAAQIIIDGLEKKETRILVGSDCKMVDLAVRLFPHGIFNNEYLFKFLSFASFTVPRFFGRRTVYSLWCAIAYFYFYMKKR